MKAVDHAKNVERDWEAIVAPDLFGVFVVETKFGRIGKRGRTCTKTFDTHENALRYYRSLISRRKSANKRIGVAYKIISQTAMTQVE